MPNPMMSMGTKHDRGSAPTSRLAISTRMPTTSPSNPKRTTRRGEASGRRRGIPVAATSSASDSGRRRTPVSMGDSPSHHREEQRHDEEHPSLDQELNRQGDEAPTSCRMRSRAGAIRGSLPVRSRRLCQRRTTQKQEEAGDDEPKNVSERAEQRGGAALFEAYESIPDGEMNYEPRQDEQREPGRERAAPIRSRRGVLLRPVSRRPGEPRTGWRSR